MRRFSQILALSSRGCSLTYLISPHLVSKNHCRQRQSVLIARKHDHIKALKLILVIATTLLTFGASANPLPSGFEYIASGAEYEKYYSARQRAIELIRNAAINPGNNLSSKAIQFSQKVIQRLLNSKFAVSTNDLSAARCSDLDMFVNRNFRDVIFICQRTRKALSHGNPRNLLIASQIFIHEGAHLVDHMTKGRSEECIPTYFELVIMENNFGKMNIPSMGTRDSYRAQCGFTEYDDVPSKRENIGD